MRRHWFPSKGLNKLEQERRALLIQLGGYELDGRPIFYSECGKQHLAQVTMRKAQRATLNGRLSSSPPVLLRAEVEQAAHIAGRQIRDVRLHADSLSLALSDSPASFRGTSTSSQA